MALFKSVDGVRVQMSPQEESDFLAQQAIDTVPNPQQTQQTASQRIQTLLDSTAQEHGYDNIISLCSYTTSKNLTWQKEGQYGVDFRDACWNKAEEIQSAVLAGTIPLPTVDQVLAQMPAVVWPV